MSNTVFTSGKTGSLMMVLFLFFTISTISAQITSTISGGNWGNPLTWVGGIAPGPGDNVVINGTVTANGSFTCNNLTVNPGAFLYNAWGYSPTLTITGNVTNHGTFAKLPDGYNFYVTVFGNITNNGSWNPNSTTLSGSNNQVISEAPGMTLEGPFTMSDSIGNLILGSDVTVSGSNWNLNRTTLLTNGHSLIANGYLLHNGYIQSNDNLVFNYSSLEQLNFSGNYTLAGQKYCRNGNVFNGTLTLTDTLMNGWSYSPTVYINGTVVNNGVLITNPLGYNLYVVANADIQNNGVWQPNSTTITGTNDHHLSQSSGKMMRGSVSLSDSVGDLILNSDFRFAGSFLDLNNTAVITNGHRLEAVNHAVLNGQITSNDTMYFNYSHIGNMKFFGNYKIDGNADVQSGVVFNDTVTILDTIFNQWSWSPTVLINGNIINKGTFITSPLGYNLYVQVTGNIRNEGKWKPNSTTLTGTSDQTIRQSPGVKFEGGFVTTDSIGDIRLGSDIVMESNTWSLNKAKLRTLGFKLITNNYSLIDGRIYSNDTLILNNSALRFMDFYGDYKIDGNLYAETGIVFHDNVTILDTLINNWSYSPTVVVSGNITNKGTIRTNPGGYYLYFDISGNVNNEGMWYLNHTYFSGTDDQIIQQLPGKKFEGPLTITDSVGDILLGSPVALAGSTLNFNKAMLRAQGHRLSAESNTLANGKIHSGDTLILNNTGINGMQFFGNYALGGNVYAQSGNIFYDTVTFIDTLFNQWGWSPNILVKGDIINKGTIRTNPGGYNFYMYAEGNIRNEGIWKFNNNYLSGTENQILSQTPGVKFEGPITVTDSIGHIIFGSAINLENNYCVFNKAKVLTKGHKLLTSGVTLNDGRIYSNDTLFLNNSAIANMNFFGNYKLDGNIQVQSNNIFHDTVTVLDTIFNGWGYSPVLTFEGNLLNNGYIITNPGGYSFFLRVKGDLINNMVLGVNSTTLFGTNPRTVAGYNAGGILGSFQVDDSVHFRGSCITPGIIFTANPNAWIHVDSGAILSLPSISDHARVLNRGRIEMSKSFDNSVSNTIGYYAASMNFSAGVTMNKVIVDHYGYQQHPTASAAVDCWWRLRNSPQNFNDTLNWLKLSYKTDALNGNLEDSLKVFYSPNAGVSWKKISTGVTLDAAGNTVNIADAPAIGHYLLSANPLGITTFQPMVETIEPRYGGNTGYLTLYIFGAGFKSTSTVRLKLAGQSDILADTTYITDAIGESMFARFNLKNKIPGVYDVVIETPGEVTLTKASHFTVVAGQRSKPWVSISGRDRFLLNRWQTFNLNYGNTANTDALGTVLVFAINDLPGLSVTFPDNTIVLPKGVIELGPDYTRIADSVALYYVTDTLTGYTGQSMRVYPFYIPYIPAGSASDASVKIKLNGSGSLKMTAWVLDPFWENIDYSIKTDNMPMEVRACITAAAMKSFATGAIGLIPGAGCYGLADKIFEPTGYIIPESITPEQAPDTWGSMFWSGVSWASSITQCATSFMPGIGQATSLGIGIVSMMIDMKDGSSVNEGCWRKFHKKSESKKNSNGVNSYDPNEIVGPQGYTPDKYISRQGNVNYRIYFENKDTATAAALEVFIQDTLDVNVFDLNTFSFSSIKIGDTSIAIQDYAKAFTVLVDMYPKIDIIVQIHGELDTISGAISWEFHSLDRVTLALTEDPDLGFLPPNVNYPEGEGSVSISCMLKNTVNHDDIISNKASIVFDFNAPILTNTYMNKIDDEIPYSSMDVLPALMTDSVFGVSWSGLDQGSGIQHYNIFVSENDSLYLLWKAMTNETSAVFTGKPGSSYKFYSIATDSIGFSEPQKLSPEASTTVVTGIDEHETEISSFRVYPNPAANQVMLDISMTASKHVWAEVFNMFGEKMLVTDFSTLNPGKSLKSISLDALKNGFYEVVLHTDNTTLQRKLIICR